MPHKSVDVICQCGTILNVYYMPKHLKTAKHARDIIREKLRCLLLRRKKKIIILYITL